MSAASPTLRHAIAILTAIAALTAFVLAIIVAHSWKASRQAASEMHVVFRAQAPLLDQAQKREDQRHAALNRDLGNIAREEQSAKTPAQISKRLPAAFMPLPRPVSVSLAPGGSDASAPAIITVPPEDLKPLFERLQDCRACEEKLATAQQDLSDERTKVSALRIERDAAVKVARGGGFWVRLRTGAKWFALGAALGAIAASAARR